MEEVPALPLPTEYGAGNRVAEQIILKKIKLVMGGRTQKNAVAFALLKAIFNTP